MIGQAHIDPVWLWPWSEGLAVVHSTFRSALDRIKETPGFAFTASSAQFYKWVSENDPAMLAEIRQRVEEGHWGLVGGWWVEPDINIPSGESLIRQGLYGQLTLRRLLGRTARIAYKPDSFGHTGTLPQILKLQGMDDYVFMRPQPMKKRCRRICSGGRHPMARASWPIAFPSVITTTPPYASASPTCWPTIPIPPRT